MEECEKERSFNHRDVDYFIHYQLSLFRMNKIFAAVVDVTRINILLCGQRSRHKR